MHTSYLPSDKCLGLPEATNHVGYNEPPVNIPKSFEKNESKLNKNSWKESKLQVGIKIPMVLNLHSYVP